MPKSPIPVKDEALGIRELVLTLNKRLAVAVVASAVSSVAMAIAILSLFPLKETKPYIVEVAKDGSAYVPPQAPAEEYKPQKATIEFFLRRWVSDAFTINQYSTVQTLDPRARMFLRGANAIGAYNDFLRTDGKFDRIAKDPALVRDVEILNVAPIAGTDNGVIIDVKLTTRSGGEATEERRLVTIYYEFFRPENRRDVEVNPIGIYVTDFKIGTGAQ